MKVAIKIAIMLILALVASAKAQQTPAQRVDSLIELTHSAHDSILPRLYCEISWLTRWSNPIIGLEYGNKTLEIAEEMGDYVSLTKAYAAMGICEKALENYEEALRINRLGQEAAIKYGVTDQLGYSYNNIGCMLYTIGRPREALNELKNAIRIGDSIGNFDISAFGYQYSGDSYRILGQYDSAIINIQKAYKIRKTYNHGYEKAFNPHAAEMLCQLCNKNFKAMRDICYFELNDPMILKHPEFIQKTYYFMAQSYLEENMLDSAKYFLDKALETADEPIYIKMSQRLKMQYEMLLKDSKSYCKSAKAYASKSDSLLQKTFESQALQIKYTLDYYKKEQKYQQLASEKRQSRILILILSVGSGLTLLFLASIMRHYNRMKKINKTLRIQQEKISNNIEYASKIQSTMLPDKEKFGSIFSDKFLIYKPRNIVSGDFYWQYSTKQHDIIVVADCTGHGVPGAMLSIVGISTLQEITKKLSDPASILNKLRDKVKKIMHQDDIMTSQKDGMDIALIIIDKETKLLKFSGAFIPLIYLRCNEYFEIKPNKNPIGIFMNEKPFTNQTLQLEKGDKIYLMSDGYCSQNNSEGKRITKSKFKEILLSINSMTMPCQGEELAKILQEWQGTCTQIDDVTVAGFEV